MHVRSTDKPVGYLPAVVWMRRLLLLGCECHYSSPEATRLWLHLPFGQPPLSAAAQCRRSLSAAAQCRRSLSAAAQCRRSLSAAAQCRRSVPPLSAAAQCRRSVPPLSAAAQCRRSVPPLVTAHASALGVASMLTSSSMSDLVGRWAAGSLTLMPSSTIASLRDAVCHTMVIW